jgi:hypothetical protein
MRQNYFLVYILLKLILTFKIYYHDFFIYNNDEGNDIFLHIFIFSIKI